MRRSVNGSALRAEKRPLITSGDQPSARSRLPADDLAIARWAADLGGTAQQLLGVFPGERPIRLAGSTATGEPLVSNGALGADVIRLAAGDGFVPHTHRGDHLLIVIAGEGTITYGGVIHPTRAGEIYLVEGMVPHAVGAITDHVLIAVGSPHARLNAHDRMTPVAYEAVVSDAHALSCLICDLEAVYPNRLHDLGCPHCPCCDCHPIDPEGA